MEGFRNQPKFDKYFPDPFSSFDLAVPFLKDAGISPANHKLLAYGKLLNDCRDGKADEYDREVFLTLWREVHELLFVIDAFRTNGIALPAEQLKKALSGAAIPTLNPDEDKSRNYLLELRVAVYFLACGYKISLNQECDIVAEIDGKTFFIECKRIYSIKKVAGRIKQACDQATERLNNATKPSKGRAILWIDPSPILQRLCPSYSAISREAVKQAVRYDLMEFVNEHIPKTNAIKDHRIKAIVVQMLWSSQIHQKPQVQTGFTSIVCPSEHASILETFFFRRFFHKLFDIG